ncbi:MAG: hypothetical protein WCO96_02750 [Actinomycetes bacterium]
MFVPLGSDTVNGVNDEFPYCVTVATESTSLSAAIRTTALVRSAQIEVTLNPDALAPEADAPRTVSAANPASAKAKKRLEPCLAAPDAKAVGAGAGASAKKRKARLDLGDTGADTAAFTVGNFI